METNSVSRRYETRRSSKAEKPIARSRVDWRRTKRSTTLLDSEEEDESASSSENEISSEDDVEGIENGESILNKSKDETVGEKENDESFHNKSKHEAVDEKEKDESMLNWSKDEAVDEKEDNESIPNKSKGETVDVASSPQGADTDFDGIEDAEESINVGKSKRVRTSVMYDSDDSDDSDIVRKVFAKRRCILDEEGSPVDQEQHMSPAEEIANRKQNRLMKLQELCQQRSSRTFSNSDRHKVDEDDTTMLDESHHSSLSEAEVSDASDKDSMKDFIVEDEEEEGDMLEQENSEDESQPQEGEQRSLLEKHIPNLPRVEHFVHFQRVVKSFLINAFDTTFLSSLYEGEREKKYAKEMLTSLHYLDERFIQPRLENLLGRSRWKERYKERVDSYPNIFINLGRAVQRSCQACELQRYCKFTVILSGKLYNNETLELDDFMSQDKQDPIDSIDFMHCGIFFTSVLTIGKTLKIGATCANRTRVYHNLKHFKYKLYQDCCWVIKNNGVQDKSVNDSVERIFKQLEEDNWIHEQYRKLQDYMDSADYFHDEKMD